MKNLCAIDCCCYYKGAANRQTPMTLLGEITRKCSKFRYAVLTFLLSLAPAVYAQSAVPEEARRAFVQGSILTKEAKTPEQQLLAVESFRKAVDLAPNWADALYNLAVAQELAGRYSDAQATLKRYIQTKPGEKEARNAQDKIYALEAKAKLASSARAAEEAILRSLDGALFVKEQTSSGSPFMKYTVEIRGRKVIYKSIYLVGGPVENVDGTCVLDGLQCEMDKKWAYTEPTRILLKISQDGREAVRTVFTNDVVSSEMALQRAK